MSDLIDRQAAIDAVIRRDANCGIDSAEVLKSLPSAQPEIIRCKDCKYTDGCEPIADGRYWCMLHGTFMYYCSDAERRTDE